MPIIISEPDAGAAAGGELVLDPVEVAEDRTELPLNAGSITVKVDGIDWGDAEIQGYMAEQAVGSSPVDIRFPNRIITLPLQIRASNAVGYTLARASLQAKVALLQREGGWLRRGTGLYADVMNATLHMPETWLQIARFANVDIVLTLETLPDWYGDEQTLVSHAGTGTLTFVENNVAGDHPGRVRLRVTEGSGNDQLGLVVGIRSRHYDSAATAALFYEAEDLTPRDLAVVSAHTEASNGSRVFHPDVGEDWTPVLSTEIAGVGHMTHTGTYRVLARVRTSTSITPQVRLVYDVGDLAFPVENPAWTIPTNLAYYLADLGTIRIDPTTGTHRWQGVVQANGPGDFTIDTFELVPVDEGYFLGRAPQNTDVGLADYAARDEFDQVVSGGSDPLTGKTLPIGGVWAGAGDADDFDVEDTDHTAVRSVSSDTAPRFAIAGSITHTRCAARVDFKTNDTDIGPGSGPGLFLRYIDVNNWVAVFVEVHGVFSSGGTVRNGNLIIRKNVAGVTTDLVTRPFLGFSTKWYTMQLFIDDAGRLLAWWGAQGTLGDPSISLNDTVLATGGALASGKVGFFDYCSAVSANVRSYNNFSAWVPDRDAVMFASRQAELRWDRHLRQDSTGVAFGPVSDVQGDLLRLPPAGMEGRPVEVYVRSSRGDLVELPDAASGAADAISGQVFYRPSWLFLPGS